MMYWLADVLRNAGLRVEETAGWQDRGHGDVWPEVVVNHHTAGGPFGRAPSLATVIYGVPAVSGPLANVLQSREPDGNDAFIIVAAGNSWNAGTGGWAGFSGNDRTVGLEIEHTGTELYPANRAELTWRFNAAILNHLGVGADRSCQHWEWNGEGGKIDVAQAPGGGSVDGNYWRNEIKNIMAGSGSGGAFTVGQMEDLAQWEKDTRAIILKQLIGDYEQGKFTGILAQWEKDTRKIITDEVTKQLKASEARIIAAINAK